MHRVVLLAILVLVGCGNPDQKQIASWASKSIEWKDQADGTRLVTFATPYFYGDKVRFDSVNGKGTGFIDGIVLAQDGSVYYTVQDEVRRLEDGQPVIHGGIYPDEIMLIQGVIGIAEPNGAANGSQPIRSETNRTSSAAGSRR